MAFCVFFRVVFRCQPAGVCFFVFSRNFFACVYVFVFQGCAVREAGVLCVGGIKKFEKSHGKVWLFGLSVVLLHSLSGTKRRRKAEPGGGSSMIGLHKRDKSRGTKTCIPVALCNGHMRCSNRRSFIYGTEYILIDTPGTEKKEKKYILQ